MSWDNKRPLTAKELEEEVRLAAESISEEQAIFSDVDGDSDAEDDLPVSSGFSTPNSGRNLKRNLRSFMNNNAAGPSHDDKEAELFEPYDSDDSIKDADYVPESTAKTAKYVSNLSDSDTESSDVIDENNDVIDDNNAISSSSATISKDNTTDNNSNNFNWSKISSQPQLYSSFTFSESLGLQCQMQSDSPLRYFELFLGEEMLTLICDQSNLYAEQQGTSLNLDKTELRAFLGVLVIMGFHRLPSIRLYWSTDLNFYVEKIASVFPLKRFLKILRFLHLNDNTKMPTRGTPQFDRLFKLRPLIDHLNQHFLNTNKPSRFLSVDESMVAFTGRSNLKQYMPMKPIKRGFKLWALADSLSGYLLQFQVYEGKTNNEQNLPLGERVVRDLTFPFQNKGYCVFFDNFFTNLPMMQNLLNAGLFGCGTIRQTRKQFPKNYLVVDKRIELGESDFTVSGDISVTKWKDRGTKCVTVASNFHDPATESSVKRKNKKGEAEMVKCPLPIADYNKFMGGVDHFDQLHAEYSIEWKSRRWWLKIFYYLIDAVIVNAFIIYKDDRTEKGMSHLNFRSQLANELINGYSCRKFKGPRPKMEKQMSLKKKIREKGRPTKVQVSVSSIGTHLPQKGTWRRCAYCSTFKKQKRSNLICEVCQIALCKECFGPFHKPA